jgi:hypothetical protein
MKLLLTMSDQSIYRPNLNKNYKIIGLGLTLIITILGLITTITLSREFTKDGPCQIAEFLAIPPEGQQIRFCYTGINLHINESLEQIRDQSQKAMLSKFQNGNNSLILFNHIVCLLLNNTDI